MVTYAENLSFGTHFCWSTGTDGTTVGAPDNNSYYYEITKLNDATIKILAFRMHSDNDYIFLKQKYGTSAWGDWIALPKRSEVDSLYFNIQRDTNNVLANQSTSFTLLDKSIGIYHYGLLIGGAGSTTVYIAHVLIENSTSNYKVTITPVLNPNNRTVTGTYDSSTGTITFTPSANFYGGFRYIDLS